MRLSRFVLAAAALLATPAALAQTAVTTYVDANGNRVAVSPTNPLPVTGGGGGGSATPTGTAGSPNAQVVSVQGVSGGTPQNVTVATALPAGSNAIGSITNTGFNVTGTLPAYAATPTFNQAYGGTAVTGALPAVGARATTGNAAADTNAFVRVLNGTNSYAWQGDSSGRGYIISVADATNTSGVAPVATAAVGSGQVVKAGSGNLFGLNVVSGASAGYVLVFNSTTVPADGAVTPLKCYVLAANSSMDLNLRAAPVFFSTGISVAFSTTGCFTKTASATAFISGDAK